MNDLPPLQEEDIRFDLHQAIQAMGQYAIYSCERGWLAGAGQTAARRALHAEARAARLEEALRALLDSWDREWVCPGSAWYQTVKDTRTILENHS